MEPRIREDLSGFRAEAPCHLPTGAFTLNPKMGKPTVEETGPREPVAPWRVRTGAVLAPLAFAVVLLTPFEDLQPPAQRLLAIVLAVIVLWITEAIPMPVTALLGVSLAVVLGVAPAREAFAPFADPLMFLFVGSFMLARAIFIHGLDRKLAFGVLSLRWVGERPGRILFAFGAVTAVISAWISNTATTAMMFAIGLSILRVLQDRDVPGRSISPRFATGLMLMTSFAASIGGLATPIGTPPNLIGLSLIREQLGTELPFFAWMLIGVPTVVILFLFLAFYLSILCPAGAGAIVGSREHLLRQKLELGPLTRGQRSVLLVFGLTTALWVLPGIVAVAWGEGSAAYKSIQRALSEGVVSLLGASLLFMLPGEKGRRALAWEEAVKIEWGVVLLYGGGLALGVLAHQSGLSDAAGRWFTRHLPLEGGLGLLIASTLTAMLISETTSNTASANIVVPVVISVARAAGVDPLEPALGATLGASLGFMLPVSTPCNAIVYGSGLIPLGRMIRYGFLLDVAGVVVIVTVVRMLTPWIR